MSNKPLRYPTLDQVENAELGQVKRWYDQLPRAANPEESEVMARITDRLVVNDMLGDDDEEEFDEEEDE